MLIIRCIIHAMSYLRHESTKGLQRWFLSLVMIMVFILRFFFTSSVFLSIPPQRPKTYRHTCRRCRRSCRGYRVRDHYRNRNINQKNKSARRYYVYLTFYCRSEINFYRPTLVATAIGREIGDPYLGHAIGPITGYGVSWKIDLYMCD